MRYRIFLFSHHYHKWVVNLKASYYNMVVNLIYWIVLIFPPLLYTGSESKRKPLKYGSKLDILDIGNIADIYLYIY